VDKRSYEKKISPFLRYEAQIKKAENWRDIHNIYSKIIVNLNISYEEMKRLENLIAEKRRGMEKKQ